MGRAFFTMIFRRTHSWVLFFSAICAQTTLCKQEQGAPSPAFVFTANSTPDPRLGVAGPPIRICGIGFLPDAEKRATIANAECAAFRVVRVGAAVNGVYGGGVRSNGDGAGVRVIVFEAKTSVPVHSPSTETGEIVRIADFSVINAPGFYQIEADGLVPSAVFAIGDDIWRQPFDVVLRGFTLWRCGTAVRAEHDGDVFEHAACHMDDGWLDHAGPDAAHEHRDGSGGWHDAGDYNKYVTNACAAVALLLQAREHFGGLPPARGKALLDEARWELEWLFKMQMRDGRVFHKLSQLNFNYWGVPEKDSATRYFSEWSTAATADFCAAMALAGRLYAKTDTAFAQRCLGAARLSWNALGAHPKAVEPEQSVFQTGAYTTPDQSHRLWAAAELWETTGETDFLRYFEGRAGKIMKAGGSSSASLFNMQGPGWNDVRDFAFGTYLRAGRAHADARDTRIVAGLREDLFRVIPRIFSGATEDTAYGRPFGVTRETWFWGANGGVAAQTYLLHLADFLAPDPRYRLTAQHALDFLFGRNFHGRSYVTGLGANPPQHPHDRRGEPAWPGYLVGGGWPDGRSWVDIKGDFRQNEIAINWNASLVYALAPFVQ